MMHLRYTIYLVSLVGSVIHPSSQDACVELLSPSPIQPLSLHAAATLADLAVTVRHEKNLLSCILHNKRKQQHIEDVRDAALQHAVVVRNKIIQDAREREGFMTDQGYHELQQDNEQKYQQERAEIIANANGALHQLARKSSFQVLHPEDVHKYIKKAESLRLLRLDLRQKWYKLHFCEKILR